jgi:hypothetical protein
MNHCGLDDKPKTIKLFCFLIFWLWTTRWRLLQKSVVYISEFVFACAIYSWSLWFHWHDATWRKFLDKVKIFIPFHSIGK